MKKFIKKLWLRLHGKHICECGDCLKEGEQCRIWDYDTKKDVYYRYCVEHCHDEGFCWMCGEFWGGCEDFDFSRNGLCSNCRSEAESEDEWDDEEAIDYNFGKLP